MLMVGPNSYPAIMRLFHTVLPLERFDVASPRSVERHVIDGFIRAPHK